MNRYRIIALLFALGVLLVALLLLSTFESPPHGRARDNSGEREDVDATPTSPNALENQPHQGTQEPKVGAEQESDQQPETALPGNVEHDPNGFLRLKLSLVER